MKNQRIYLMAVMTAIIGLSLLYPVLGGGWSTVEDREISEIVYVDTGTGEAFLLQSRSSPENHPKTGKPTLIPGMYCEKCKAWKPVGALQSRQSRQSVRRCPIHKELLVDEGPLPE